MSYTRTKRRRKNKAYENDMRDKAQRALDAARTGQPIPPVNRKNDNKIVMPWHRYPHYAVLGPDKIILMADTDEHVRDRIIDYVTWTTVRHQRIMSTDPKIITDMIDALEIAERYRLGSSRAKIARRMCLPYHHVDNVLRGLNVPSRQERLLRENPNIRQEVIEDYIRGIRPDVICSAYKIDPTILSSWVRDHGLAYHPKGMTYDDTFTS